MGSACQILDDVLCFPDIGFVNLYFHELLFFITHYYYLFTHLFIIIITCMCDNYKELK